MPRWLFHKIIITLYLSHGPKCSAIIFKRPKDSSRIANSSQVIKLILIAPHDPLRYTRKSNLQPVLTEFPIIHHLYAHRDVSSSLIMRAAHDNCWLKFIANAFSILSLSLYIGDR